MNAFSSVNSVVNFATGGVGGSSLPSGATLPVAKINTLADVLATCINSAGGTAGDNSPCGNLFANTTVNGAAPTDTITATMNMAHSPHQNVAALTNSASAAGPFQPTLSSAPNDLNIVITYAAGGFSTPRAVAVDTLGNVWVPNTGTSTVTEMTATGSLLSPPLGYAFSSVNAPVAIATDQSGNAWVANNGAATTTKILAGGANSTAYTVGSTPSSVAIDAYGSVFVVSSGSNSISKISSTGLVTTTVVPGATAPIGLALNPR
jgi:streptogramin lyase